MMMLPFLPCPIRTALISLVGVRRVTACADSAVTRIVLMRGKASPPAEPFRMAGTVCAARFRRSGCREAAAFGCRLIWAHLSDVRAVDRIDHGVGYLLGRCLAADVG